MRQIGYNKYMLNYDGSCEPSELAHSGEGSLSGYGDTVGRGSLCVLHTFYHDGRFLESTREMLILSREGTSVTFVDLKRKHIASTGLEGPGSEWTQPWRREFELVFRKSDYPDYYDGARYGSSYDSDEAYKSESPEVERDIAEKIAANNALAYSERPKAH